MSHLRLLRLVGALLAVAAVAAVTTAGIALAQGGHHHARHGRSHHAAKASGTACPAPSNPKSAQRSGAVAVPGSVGEKEARAQKEALAGKVPAEKEGPTEKEGPAETDREVPAEKAARTEKERLVAAKPPCQVGSGAAAERGSLDAALRG